VFGSLPRERRDPQELWMVELVRSTLDGDDGAWDLWLDGIWCYVRPPGHRVREQGWKLHVSATRQSASGAGKTTLASLVGRLRDPDEGAVLLDGVPVASLDPGELRRAVAYAFERPALLGGTIAEAIAYGRPAATHAHVRAAAVAAEADGFVRRLPDGYDTPLRRAPMSGGEAQRLGLARAIAQGERVLVLDDATSSLDTAAEMKVSAALARLRSTRIVVAHRAATAARADLVAWIEDGRVRAYAPHAELWEHPEYRAVFAAPEAVA
jgi:ATP-binding cassette, subfamily B, bacterial